jgi:hypothetical protein
MREPSKAVFSRLYQAAVAFSNRIGTIFINHRKTISLKVIIMLFMIIEHYKDRDGKAVYRRFREQGRMAPDGLRYVASWTEVNCDRCFQIMECDDPELLKVWASHWEDLVDFEFIQVLTSKEMSEKMLE